MTDQHPITPPPELVQQWVAEIWHEGTPVRVAASDLHIATQAARWGADTELDACCEWLQDGFGDIGDFPEKLRAARRPKPPSLAEEAHGALSRFFSNAHTQASQMTQDFEILRHAVQRLQELESNG